jgi:hypothetical protein
MSPEIQDLVLDAIFSILVQLANVMFKSLPRRCFSGILKRRIRRVGLFNETEVFLCLMSVLVWKRSERRSLGKELQTYIVKGVSISIGKSLLEDVCQNAELIFGIRWW